MTIIFITNRFLSVKCNKTARYNIEIRRDGACEISPYKY